MNCEVGHYKKNDRRGKIERKIVDLDVHPFDLESTLTP